MVYPVNELVFKIATTGRASTPTFAVVAEVESMSPSFDNNVEEWSPMEQKGWTRRMMTGKSITFSVSGKRNYGDIGNDYVAGLAYKNGNDCNSILQVEFPNGDTFEMDCVINVTSTFGGDSTAVDTLEWECLSDGQPTYVEA